MNNLSSKGILVVAVVALVVGGVVGYLLNGSDQAGVNFFGAANSSTTVISYYSVRGNADLWDVLNSMNMDDRAVRAPLAGLAVGSASVSWGTLTANTNSSSSVINVPLGGTIGDLVLVSPAASGTASFGGQITTTGTTNASATVYAVNATTTSAIIGTLTTRVWVLPSSSFVVPSAIRTSTSTSF